MTIMSALYVLDFDTGENPGLQKLMLMLMLLMLLLILLMLMLKMLMLMSFLSMPTMSAPL